MKNEIHYDVRQIVVTLNVLLLRTQRKWEKNNVSYTKQNKNGKNMLETVCSTLRKISHLDL